MKTLLRKSAIVAALFALLAGGSTYASTQENGLVYKLAYNQSIGITVDNATGADYTIRDEKGNVVMKGTVKNDKTFFISARKLGKGTYRFFIGHLAVQQFEIR